MFDGAISYQEVRWHGLLLRDPVAAPSSIDGCGSRARNCGLVAPEMERRHDELNVRVSDAERERVVDQLKRHVGEGRLTVEEFSDRTAEAYASKTVADLDHCLRELPLDRGARAEQARRRRRDWHRGLLRRFAVPNAVCIGIWALTGAGYFWPAWVLFGTGVALMGRLMSGPHRDHRPELSQPRDDQAPRPR